MSNAAVGVIEYLGTQSNKQKRGVFLAVQQAYTEKPKKKPKSK